jgi:hypothetical protein
VGTVANNTKATREDVQARMQELSEEEQVKFMEILGNLRLLADWSLDE